MPNKTSFPEAPIKAGKKAKDLLPKPSKPSERLSLSFMGTIEEQCSCVPESCVDEVIKIFNLDPDSLTEQYFPAWHPITLKTKLWIQISDIVRRFWVPTPTEAGTTPKKCKELAETLRGQLLSTLNMMKNLQWEEIYDYGEVSREFMVADIARRQSAHLKSKRDGTSMQVFAGGFAKQSKELRNKWPELYPFDSELKNAIDSVEPLVTYFDGAVEYYQNEIKGRGEVKRGKMHSDRCIVSICFLYKEITGKEPSSWPTGSIAVNSGQYTGKIIPLLQAILPHVSYNQEITPAALQKRLQRLKKAGRHKHNGVWSDYPQDSKK
jgi:hypothetical protein